MLLECIHVVLVDGGAEGELANGVFFYKFQLIVLADREMEDELTNQHRLKFIKIYPIGPLAFSSTINKYNH